MRAHKNAGPWPLSQRGDRYAKSGTCKLGKGLACANRTARARSRAMKVSTIRAYQIDLPLHAGSYKWSGVSPGLCRRGAGGARRARPASPVRRPAGVRPPERADGRSHARASLRQVGDRHGVLGHRRQGERDARRGVGTTATTSYVTVSFADDAPRRRDGRMAASREPGLGVCPTLAALGAPVLEVHA
jgi:hypothetical protein